MFHLRKEPWINPCLFIDGRNRLTQPQQAGNGKDPIIGTDPDIIHQGIPVFLFKLFHIQMEDPRFQRTNSF